MNNIKIIHKIQKYSFCNYLFIYNNKYKYFQFFIDKKIRNKNNLKCHSYILNKIHSKKIN